MRLALASMVVGALAGFIARGRLSGLLTLPLRAVWLLGVFLCAYGAANAGAPGAFGLLLLALGAFTVFAFVNSAPTVGMAVVGLGMALNFLVVADNHGMPFRPSAVVEAGAVRAGANGGTDLAPETTALSHPQGSSDQLTVLGDIIPVRPLRDVVSIGDILVAVGLGLVVFNAMDAEGLVQRRRRAAMVAPTPFVSALEPIVPDLRPPSIAFAARTPPVAPTDEWDQRIALLRATGDVTVMLDLVEADRIDRSTLDIARTDACCADDSAPSLTARLAVARALLQHGSESILPVLIPSAGAAAGHAAPRAASTAGDA